MLAGRISLVLVDVGWATPSGNQSLEVSEEILFLQAGKQLEIQPSGQAIG